MYLNIGSKIRCGNHRGTITKIHAYFVLVELRDLPKVQRPKGRFYEKRILSTRGLIFLH